MSKSSGEQARRGPRAQPPYTPRYTAPTLYLVRRVDEFTFTPEAVGNPAPKRKRVKLRLVSEVATPSREAFREEMRGKRARRVAALMGAQDGRCYICEAEFSATNSPTIDHVKPRALGGRSSRNILLACAPCNNAKADREPFGHEMERLAQVNAVLRCEEVF